MTTALSGSTSQSAEVIVGDSPASPNGVVSQSAVVVVGGPWGALDGAVTQSAEVIVYGYGVPTDYVTQAWTFVFDGHTFYVLQLGAQGTWVYDTSTQEWAEWETGTYGFWNMVAGCTWGYRTVAGSSASPFVWELVPSALTDEGYREISHAVTGIIDVRSRKYYSVESVRVTASAGLLDEVSGATFTLSYSDDQGVTWSQGYDITLTEGNSTQELAWRSMGSFAAPGRVFQFSDVGGLIRLDGADVYIDNFDEDPQQPSPQ